MLSIIRMLKIGGRTYLFFYATFMMNTVFGTYNNGLMYCADDHLIEFSTTALFA